MRDEGSLPVVAKPAHYVLTPAGTKTLCGLSLLVGDEWDTPLVFADVPLWDEMSRIGVRRCRRCEASLLRALAPKHRRARRQRKGGEVG